MKRKRKRKRKWVSCWAIRLLIACPELIPRLALHTSLGFRGFLLRQRRLIRTSFSFFLHFLKKILFFCATISLSILDFNNWPQIFTYWVETYPLSLSRNLPCDPYYCHSRNLDSTAYQCALHTNHHVAQNIMRVTIMNLHFFEVESIAIWEYMG